MPASLVQASERSARLDRLRDAIVARGGSFVEYFNPFCRDVALWRALVPRRSVVQVRAALLRELVALAPLEIGPDWSLAGEHLQANAHYPAGSFGGWST